MATYNFDSDTYADQLAALENSASMVKDGTKVTGNVQIATGTYEAAATYTTGDVVNVEICRLPKGVRILPALCSCLRTSGGTYDWGITECTNLVGLLTGNQSSGSGTASILTDAQAVTTEPCVIQAEFTLGAALPASFKAQFVIAYAATS